jgi:hypothetical protein
MADEEKSVLSSLSGLLVDTVTENSKRLLEATRRKDLKASLASDAKANTVLNGGFKGTNVVESPLIRCMMNAYRAASTGRVIVVCTPTDSGKTHASEFLMHGNHLLRPKRSLKISAASMKNFPVEFSQDLCAESSATSLGLILCNALVADSKDEPSVVTGGKKVVAAAGAGIVDTMLCTSQGKVKFEEAKPITVYGADEISALRPVLEPFPLLILDNFNEDTDENKAFVQKLLNEAAEIGVFVFILTVNRSWASKLIKLNGGAKIKPLFGNVNNKDYTLAKKFTGVPIWNDMIWPVKDLRALILPICTKNSIDPVTIVPDDAIMTPVEAKDAAVIAAFE